MLLNRLPSLLHKFYDSPSKSNPRLAGGFFMGGVRAEWRVRFAYPPYDDMGEHRIPGIPILTPAPLPSAKN